MLISFSFLKIRFDAHPFVLCLPKELLKLHVFPASCVNVFRKGAEKRDSVKNKRDKIKQTETAENIKGVTNKARNNKRKRKFVRSVSSVHKFPDLLHNHIVNLPFLKLYIYFIMDIFYNG